MADFQVTRQPFADAISEANIAFDLDGAPPGQPLADRFVVYAECPTQPGSLLAKVSDNGLVKKAVQDGAIDVDEALALRDTLAKLINWLLGDYD